MPNAREPEACGAIDSSLWEVDHLRKHCCPTVASLAGLFASPITPTTQPVDLAPLAALTYASLGQLETRKKLRQVPTAIRPPQALFGRDPVNEIAGQQPLLSGLGSWR